jgi:hypothetical protein
MAQFKKDAFLSRMVLDYGRSSTFSLHGQNLQLNETQFDQKKERRPIPKLTHRDKKMPLQPFLAYAGVLTFFLLKNIMLVV